MNNVLLRLSLGLTLSLISLHSVYAANTVTAIPETTPPPAEGALTIADIPPVFSQIPIQSLPNSSPSVSEAPAEQPSPSQ